MEEEEIRREAEGAGPTSEDPRPESIGADAESLMSAAESRVQGAGDNTATSLRTSSYEAEDSMALSQHTFSEGDTSAHVMRPLDPYEFTLSQHPLEESSASILDMSLAQYPMRDSATGEFALSHRLFQQNNVCERLEPLGVEEVKSDDGRGSDGQWVALQEDCEGSPMKQPIEDLAQNLSVGAVELAILELGNEEEKDSVNKSVSQVSHDLIEGILALSRSSGKDSQTYGSTEESPAGPLSYHPLGESSVSSPGLSIGRITGGESTISQHTLETSGEPSPLVRNSALSLSDDLTTGNITEEQSPAGPQWFHPKEDTSICSNRLSTGHVTCDATTLSQYSLEESTSSQQLSGASHQLSTGYITGGQSTISQHLLEDSTASAQRSLRQDHKPEGKTPLAKDASALGFSQTAGLKGSMTSQLSPTVDQTMQFQPDVHSMNIGDSYLEKRPISSSTPSSSKMLSQLSIKETSMENESSVVYKEKAKGTSLSRPTEELPVESEPSSEASSGTELKEPVALIRKAGIDNYMTPEERARLVVTSPPDANLSIEERKEIFSDIFRAPPPGELTRSKSGSQRSLTGSERSVKSDKRSLVSEVETNRGHFSCGMSDGVSFIPPEDAHSRETSERSAPPSVNHSKPSAQDTQEERLFDGAGGLAENTEEGNDPSLIGQLAIHRVSELVQSFECRSTTSHISADRSTQKSSSSLIQKSETSQVHTSTLTEGSEIHAQDVSANRLVETSQTNEARSLEKERLAIGGFERLSSSNKLRSPSDLGQGKEPLRPSGPASLPIGLQDPEHKPVPPNITSSGHHSLPPFVQCSSTQRSALEQLAVVTVPAGPSDYVQPTTVGGVGRQESKTSTDSGDQDTSVWSQPSGDGEPEGTGAGLQSGRLSSQSNVSFGSSRSEGHRNSISTGWDKSNDGVQDRKSTSRPSSGRSYTQESSALEKNQSEKVGGESLNSALDTEEEEDRQSVSSTLTDHVAALLAKPTHEGLTLVRPPSRDDSELYDQRPGSRPHSSSSVDTLKDVPLEGMETLPLPTSTHAETRNLESPHSQFSDSSSTSYQDLPNSIHPSTVAPKRRVSAIAETSFEERPPSHSSTVVSEEMDPDVKQILKKYGEVLSEDDQKQEPIELTHRLTPTGSVAESDDTNLTNRVNRLLQGPDLDKSYLYEDPARSITLGLASGSTTRTNTPPPTVSDLNSLSKSQESLNKLPQISRSKSRESVCSQKGGSELQQEQLKGEDTLSERVRHLLGEASSGPGSNSSGRSSRTSSVNYDVLQNELEEIQRGLAILQKGELSLEQDLASSVGTNSRRMSDASEGTASKVTESEVGTPRKFSWDYGDLKGEDMSGYRFVTSRSDLQTQIDHTEMQRQQPEGVSGRSQSGAIPKSSSSFSTTEKSTSSSNEEGKYTRIARELEKETSPQRRVSLTKTHGDSGPATWSGTTSTRYDFIGRSYDSLTRSGLDAEVQRVLNQKTNLDDSGHRSLSKKVNDLMERESPQRQAYKYLAEAEDSMRLMQTRRESRLHASDTDLHNASPQNISASSSFQLTPIPKRSFHAFGNVQSFLTTQLNKMSTAQFDTSIELRSPLKRQMEQQFKSTSSDFRESDHLHHLDLHRHESSYKTGGKDMEPSRSSRLTPTDRVNKREAVSVEVESSITDYTPGPRPVTMQDYVDGTYRGKLSERLKDRERGKQEKHHEKEDHPHVRSSERSSADLVHTPYTRVPTEGGRGEPSTAPSDHVVEDQLTPRSDSNGSVDSVVYPGSAPQSARSDRSGRRSTGTTSGLRPYRPPGSNDLYYVESSTDDGNVSVANSETTVESTHIGSDDARPPHFPSHWLGSRSDPTQPSPSGIYCKKASPEDQTLLKVLDPIVENKSFEETKLHEVSSCEDKTLVEESFEGKNRSHHNNSGQHEQSDASTDQNTSGDLSSDTHHHHQPHQRERSRAQNRDMRYLNEGLEEGAQWGQTQQRYQDKELYERQASYDGAASAGYTKEYPDIPIARSDRYRDHRDHRDHRHAADLTPGSRHLSDTNKPYAFGTPQKHQADRSYNSPASRSRYSDKYPLRSPDLSGMNETDRSAGESYRYYREEDPAGSRSRDQFDSTEDEITSRLQLYPGEEVHTMEETLDRSKERFTPLQPEMTDDAEVEALSRQAWDRTTTPGRPQASVSPSSPGSHPYHLRDYRPEQRPRSQYRSPPAMPAPTPPIPRRPGSASPTRRSARSTSPTSRSPSPGYRAVSADEYARWDEEHRSPPVEVTRRRMTERPPMAPPPPPPAARQAWTEGSRDRESGSSGGDLHRAAHEQQRAARDSLSTKGKEADMNDLWERFQRRTTESSSDGEGGVKAVDMRKLSSLLRNPAQHLTQDVVGSRGSGSRREEVDYREGERSARQSRRERDDRSLQEEANRRSRPSSKTSPTRTPHRSSRETSEPTSPSRAVTFNTETSQTTSGASDVSETRAPSTVNAPSRPTHPHHPQLREEATLQSIPEDTTLESVSTTDVTSSESNGTRSLLQSMPDDPKLLKLQTKILRQRQKHEMEKLREQRRRQKIQKLERMLATKQTGGTSEDGEDGEEESEATLRGYTAQYGHHRGVGYDSGKQSQHTTDHSTTSPVPRPVSSSSGKSTSTPFSLKGSTGGTDMSFAVSDITSASTATHAMLRSDESSDTLVDDMSPRGTTTTATTTTQDETTPQQSETDGPSVCACCNKKKGKSSRSKSPTRSSSRSKSYKKVSSRSKSPSKVVVKSRSPVRGSSRSKSPTKVSRSQSPTKYSKPRSPSPTSKRPHGRSASPTSSKKSRREQDLETYEEVREKPLKEKHNKNSSYLEFDKPSRDRTSQRENDRVRREEKITRSEWDRSEKHTTEDQKQQKHKKSSGEKRSKENRERPREKQSEKQRSSREYREERRPAPMEVDEGSEGYSDFDTERSVGLRTIGVNVPTPISLSPPTRRKVRDVTMVSEAVQTTPHLHRYTMEDGDRSRRGVSRSSTPPAPRRPPPGAFTPESTTSPTSSTENVQPSYRREQTKTKARAGQAGLAWYIPLTDPRPWRRPLRERQAHAISRDTWPPQGPDSWRAGYDLGSSSEQSRVTTSDAEIYLSRAARLEQEGDKLTPKISLQEALESRRQDFISQSRERMKHLMLKSEERQIQDLHARQRAELFRIDRKLDPNKNAHPYSENLFKPKKRMMTKKEMKELTNKKYANLEEVKRKGEDTRRLEEYRTNRVRAQVYKQKILSKVLHKKGAWIS